MKLWNKLSMKEKHDIIRESVSKGIHSLDDIKAYYDNYYKDDIHLLLEGGPEEDKPVLFTPYLNDTPMQAAMRQLNADYSKPENRTMTYNATYPQSTSETPLVAQPDGSFKIEPKVIGLSTMAEEASYLPGIGDAMDAAEIYSAAKQGDYGTAATLAGLILIPNILEKPAKKVLRKIGLLNNATTTALGSSEESSVIRTLQDNGKIRLSLPSHTKDKPRQFVLEPAGDNKYYVHMRMWDDIENKVPASNVTNEEKQQLFDALYDELPEGAEILFPKSGPGNYATRGTVAGLQRLSRDPRFTPGNAGTLQYIDKDGKTIKTYNGTSFIKTPQVTAGNPSALLSDNLLQGRSSSVLEEPTVNTLQLSDVLTSMPSYEQRIYNSFRDQLIANPYDFASMPVFPPSNSEFSELYRQLIREYYPERLTLLVGIDNPNKSNFNIMFDIERLSGVGVTDILNNGEIPNDELIRALRRLITDSTPQSVRDQVQGIVNRLWQSQEFINLRNEINSILSGDIPLSSDFTNRILLFRRQYLSVRDDLSTLLRSIVLSNPLSDALNLSELSSYNIDTYLEAMNILRNALQNPTHANVGLLYRIRSKLRNREELPENVRNLLDLYGVRELQTPSSTSGTVSTPLISTTDDRVLPRPKQSISTPLPPHITPEILLEAKSPAPRGTVGIFKDVNDASYFPDDYLLEAEMKTRSFEGWRGASASSVNRGKGFVQGLIDSRDNALDIFRAMSDNLASGLVYAPHSLSLDSHPLYESFVLKKIKNGEALPLTKDLLQRIYGRTPTHRNNSLGVYNYLDYDPKLRKFVRTDEEFKKAYKEGRVKFDKLGDITTILVDGNPIGSVRELGEEEVLKKYNDARKLVYLKMDMMDLYPGDATSDAYGNVSTPYFPVVVKLDGGPLVHVTNKYEEGGPEDDNKSLIIKQDNTRVANRYLDAETQAAIDAYNASHAKEQQEAAERNAEYARRAQMSGAVNNVYPEFDVIALGRGIATSLGKKAAKQASRFSSTAEKENLVVSAHPEMNYSAKYDSDLFRKLYSNYGNKDIIDKLPFKQIEPKNLDLSNAIIIDNDKRFKMFEPGTFINYDIGKMSADDVVKVFGPETKPYKSIYDIAKAHNFEGKYAKLAKDAEFNIKNRFAISKSDPDVARGLAEARSLYSIPEYRARFDKWGTLGDTFVDDALARIDNVKLQGRTKNLQIAGQHGVHGGAYTSPDATIIGITNSDSSSWITDMIRHEANHVGHGLKRQPKWMEIHNEKLRPILREGKDSNSALSKYYDEMDEIVERSKTAVEYANKIRKPGESLNDALNRVADMADANIYDSSIPADIRLMIARFTKSSSLNFWKNFVGGVAVPAVTVATAYGANQQSNGGPKGKRFVDVLGNIVSAFGITPKYPDTMPTLWSEVLPEESYTELPTMTANQIEGKVAPLPNNNEDFIPDFTNIKTKDNFGYNIDNLTTAYHYFKDNMKLNNYQIASLLANGIAESGFDPKAHNPKTSAKGLYLWLDGRYKYSSDKMSNTELLNELLQYINDTLNNTEDLMSWHHGGDGSGYNKAIEAHDRFYNAKNLYDAVHSFTYGYNRPDSVALRVKQRYDLALKILERLLAKQHKDGGKIYIKPENRGKFTALKKRTGHSASWFKAHGTPALRKMATFALNAKKWKHDNGGYIDIPNLLLPPTKENLIYSGHKSWYNK